MAANQLQLAKKRVDEEAFNLVARRFQILDRLGFFWLVAFQSRRERELEESGITGIKRALSRSEAM